MEYTTLGSSGLEISRICLGCNIFTSSKRQAKGLVEKESRETIERAIDLGINFFDTANSYSNGESERVLGDVLQGYDRDKYVVATKVHPGKGPDPYPPTDQGGGLSRKAVEQSLAASLDRLDMDAIDLYQIHRWDYGTPITETLRALDDAVRRNQVRYIGASSMWAHQFANALHTSDRLGLERFVSMQHHYNAVYREEEREMVPLCLDEGIGLIPWSPLGRGYLARPHRNLAETERGFHTATKGKERVSIYRAGGGDEINERIEELSDELGASMAQISLAWILRQEHVSAPTVSTTNIEQLEENVEAVELSLDDSDVEWLEEPYEPVPVEGHE